jgi:hypothetical protein
MLVVSGNEQLEFRKVNLNQHVKNSLIIFSYVGSGMCQ